MPSAKINLISRLFFYLIIIGFGFFEENFKINIFLSALVFLCLAYECEWRSGVHMMFLTAFATFMYLPAVVASYYSEADFELFYMTSICSFVFIMRTKGLFCLYLNQSEKHFRVLFYLFAALIMILSLGEQHWVFSLWGPFIMFFALNLQSKNHLANTYKFILFLAIFGIYSAYAWNGFGRSVTFGFLMTGSLYYLYSLEYKVPKILWAIVPSFFSTLLSNRSLLNLEHIGLEASLRDSAFGPYILASSFIDYNKLFGNDFAGFLDDIIFTALSFWPRDWWASKPYGFGFEFVVRHMDPSYAEAGHSIASTMIGDHLYFLGYFGIVTAVVMTLVVARLSKYFYSLKNFYGFAVVIMACYMLVFVWGGMSSLSARLIYPFIVFSGYIVFMKFYKFIFKIK